MFLSSLETTRHYFIFLGAKKVEGIEKVEKILTHNFHLPSRKLQSTNYFTYNRILTGFPIKKL
jgi:hypothetical protein